MTTPQWQNLPEPIEPRPAGDWTGFSTDPRLAENQQLRASDADRSLATTILGSAYDQGRLDRDEYDQRIDQAMSAKHLGELVPILADVVIGHGSDVPTAQSHFQPGGVPSPLRTAMGRMPTWWIGLALILNAIWLMTSLSAGHLIYYWPMWPMFGTAIPVVLGMISGTKSARPQRRQLPPPPPPEQDLR